MTLGRELTIPECVRMWNEAVVVYLRYFPLTRLERLKKTTERLASVGKTDTYLFSITL
jgi:hypothetical protein